MTRLDDGLYAAMLERGMSRRSFLKFSAAMATALALPAAYASRISAAVAVAPRMPVIWLRGQACAGDSAAFRGASSPTIAELLLDLLSVEYDPMIMAPAGPAAERSRTDAMAKYPNGYIAIVEGAIPVGGDGYCTIGGRAFREIVGEVCRDAVTTIAVGACAFDGGSPAAAGGPTGATGVSGIVPDAPLINLPGCPVNARNLAATIVHYLTFKTLPATDSRKRPLFAYSGLVHNQCERRAHFEFGEFVLSWGDEAAQKGWCLYKMGCKGPETNANCPTVRYAGGASWPVKAGHGCVGCTMPRFWDSMSPFYRRLPSPLPFAPNVTVDQVGQALVGGVVGLTGIHGAASYVRQRRIGAAKRGEVRAAAAFADTGAPTSAIGSTGPAGTMVSIDASEPAVITVSTERAEIAAALPPAESIEPAVATLPAPPARLLAAPADPAAAPAAIESAEPAPGAVAADSPDKSDPSDPNAPEAD